MEIWTIVLIGFLSVLLIAIGLFIYFISQTQTQNAWQVSPWLISTSVTPVNNLSCWITGTNHCMSDAILADTSNNYNSCASAVYVSNDNGNTFSFDIFPIYNLQLYGVSSNGSVLAGIGQDLASGETNLWMSTDGNSTWNSIPTDLTTPYGMSMDICGTYLCVCGVDPADSILVCNNNVDANGTLLWTLSDAPSGCWLNVLMSTSVDLTGRPILSTALYSGNNDTEVPDLYYSADGGLTWTASGTLSVLLQNTSTNPINNTNTSNCNGAVNMNLSVLDPTMTFVFQSMSRDGTYVSVIVNTSVYVSSDRGKTWKQSNTDPSITDWCTISVSSDGKTQLLCSNTMGVYQSTNSGMNWILQKELSTAMTNTITNTFGTVTSWVGANLFDGGQSATTFEYFYYTYTKPPTLYLAMTILCSILLIALLVLALYFKWFTLQPQPDMTVQNNIPILLNTPAAPISINQV